MAPFYKYAGSLAIYRCPADNFLKPGPAGRRHSRPSALILDEHVLWLQYIAGNGIFDNVPTLLPDYRQFLKAGNYSQSVGTICDSG